MITIKKGNIFTTQCQTIVNMVNCVGVMGAGIAFEFRLRNPDMYAEYQAFCDKKMIPIGKLWLYRNNKEALQSHYRQILNFPTKKHWKDPSHEKYLIRGLENFVQTFKKRKITSIAFPLLGADKGGLCPEKSIGLIRHYMAQCQIPVEIWKFDSGAKDDLYDRFKMLMTQMSDEQLKSATSLRVDAIRKLRQALMEDQINSLSGLLQVEGIGQKTIEKSFSLMRNFSDNSPNQQLKLL